MSPWSEVITLVSLTSDHSDTMYQLSLGLWARLLQCSRGRLFRVTDARARGEAGPEAEEDGYRGWEGLGGLVQHHLAGLLLSSRWFSQPLSSDHPLPPVSYSRPILSVISSQS